MNRLLLTLSIFFIFSLGSIFDSVKATHTPPVDTNVHFEVWDGNQWVNVFPPAAASANIGTVFISPERTSTNPISIAGGNTITVERYSSAEGPKITWNNDQEFLWLQNVKISSASAITDVRFRVWRNFPAGAHTGTYYFTEQAGGWLRRPNGASAVGAKIVMRGSIESTATPATTAVNLGNLVLPPNSVSCTQDKLVKCATTTSSNISWLNAEPPSPNPQPITLSTPDHLLSLEFWLTLPHAAAPTYKDYLQFANTSTGGLIIDGASSSGAGGTGACDHCQGAECETCQIDCPTTSCTPIQKVNAFCMTSFSSSTGPTSSTQCPDCITVDGQVAQSAKVPLFAKSNWDNLLEDMARGHGEHLASLASLLGVPREQYPAFFVIAQEEYNILSLHDKVPAPEAMIAGLRQRWATQPGLVSLAVRPTN